LLVGLENIITNKILKNNKYKIGIIGLGYVGLPLAVEFGKKFNTIGFDINESRIKELNDFNDNTLEVSSDELISVIKQDCNSEVGLLISNDKKDLSSANFFIVTVPTPVNIDKKPNLSYLEKASDLVGSLIKKNDIVVYESTVYPGLTEEFCIPIIERKSNLIYNKDFFAGYSPERINPGDKNRRLVDIVKVVSGSNSDISLEINNVYKQIITAGTHLASSIKVAEAAKVIENAQRDINIAFVNELSKIFNLLEINTYDVLEAARTKWNFLDFRPGLVGGHCIGVDPYYLADKAISLGYDPQIILNGRKINDSMSDYVGSIFINILTKKVKDIKKSKILVLGVTFKENCPDIRNSKVFNLIKFLMKKSDNVIIFDPIANNKEVNERHNLVLNNKLPKQKFDATIVAVCHNEFSILLNNKKNRTDFGIIYDLKGKYPEISDYSL
tara:strand:+ start:4681 stop:6009 length:1329 start_codon:yes stop_codon:yes gene_type:complete